MLRDETFITKMTDTEKSAWLSFKQVVEKFVGNDRSADDKKVVANMVRNFGELGCLMNLKLYFLHSHIDEFPVNCGGKSEEQGDRFHQDFKDAERRFQGHWDINMMADFCWLLKTVGPKQKKTLFIEHLKITEHGIGRKKE